jgi:putative membrane protein
VDRGWRVDPDEGSEPDYRYTLANERTFLAYVRTALGLLAGGVAVRQLIEPFDVTAATTALALLSVGASIVLVGGGYLRWVAVQRAARRGDPLPAARLVPLVAVVIAGLAAITFVLIAVA